MTDELSMYSVTTAMMDDSVRNEPLIVCPTEAELQAEPIVNVPCTVDGCNKIFNTSAARNIHIIQTHKIYKDDDERKRFDRSQQKTMSKVIKHFYCPVKMCNRSIEWKKPFSRLSLLKQHYYILHAEKKYPCQKCEKRFSTQSQHATHERDCGKEFFCTCGEKHNSMTALYMHAKRKQHDLPDQYCKRKKPEPVKETYILVVPVPCGNPADIQRTIRQPTTLLPHPSTCTFIPLSGITPIGTSATSFPRGTAAIGVGSQVKTESRTSATTATQTDESRVTQLPPKHDTSSSFAQTALSCFPSFIPMTDGPRRHKKTLAVQTHANWTPGQLPGKMASTETQTLDGQGNASQGQTSLSLQSAVAASLPPLEQSVSGPFFPPFPNPVSSSVPQETSKPNSMEYNCGESTAQGSQLVPLNSQLDANSSQTPWNVAAVGTNQPVDSARPSANLRSNMFTPNEALTQTDLTFQNFPVYNTSETQTPSHVNVNDAMTDTNENSATQAAEVRPENPPVGPSVPSKATSMSPTRLGLGVENNSTSLSSALLGVGNQTSATSMSTPHLGLGDQTNSTSMSPEPLCAGVQTSAANVNPTPLGIDIRTNATSEPPAPVNIGNQNSDISVPPASQGLGVEINTPANMSSAPDIAMSGLHLLFLASTEHRANSLGLPRMDESPCCQHTQTGFDTDTGHQETQTGWDWSLDEFSFLDQHTQTALSSSNSISSTTTTMPEIDQFCQTGIDLCSPFTFSNTETQTVSVFDLEMFGNSISVQTEAGSESKLLGEDGLSEINKQVQVTNMGSQQERVCADVQTEEMDFNRLRSRQMGSSQLASSHTQTSLWEDIESMIRSDSFTQTQFP